MKIIGLVLCALLTTSAAYAQQSTCAEQLIAGSPWKLIWKNTVPIARGQFAEGTVEFAFRMEQSEFKGATQNLTGASAPVGPMTNLRIDDCRIRGRAATGVEFDVTLRDGRISGTGVAQNRSRIMYESAPRSQ